MELCFYMPTQEPNIILIVVFITCVFFIAAVFILFNITAFIERRKRHKEEKQKMQDDFTRELVQTQFEVQEQTRRNLAADLHDNIGQLLSLTSVTLASINIEDKQKTLQKISDTQELVTRSIRELRQLSKIIHGEQLIQQGLLKTIEQEITWLERNGHYTVQFTCDLPDLTDNTADKDLFIYRLLQECLNNIIKHSGASQIGISLRYQAPDLQLIITDNGVGFDPEEKLKQKGGLGLLNMQKRVGLLQGTIEVSAAKNRGTSLTFTIPYP